MTPKTLKAWRLRLHLSKAKAARELGLSPNGYATLEAGKGPIKRQLALACAAIAHGLPPIE